MEMWLLLGLFLPIIGCLIVLSYYWIFYKFIRTYRFGQRFINAFNKKHANIDNPLFESNNFSERAIFSAILIVVFIIIFFVILGLNGVSFSLYDWKLLFPVPPKLLFAILPFALLSLLILFVAFFLPILLCSFSDSIVQNEKGFLLRAFGEEYFLENKKFKLYIGETIAPLYGRPGRPAWPHQMIYFEITNRNKKGKKINKKILCLLPATTKNKQFIEQNLILEAKEM